jgi:hypothetical protein
MGISTRQQNSWQQRLKDAENDEDIIRLRDSMKRKGVDPDSYPALQLAPTEGEYQKGGAAQADDEFTDEDRAAIGHAWRELGEDKAHNGKLHYSPIPVAGRVPGSFRIPKDVFEALGQGDIKMGAAALHATLGVEDLPERPDLIHPDVIRIIGNGSLAAGRRVLERFVARVRRQSRDGPVLQHVGAQHDSDHGWRVKQ